jgi:methylated-DNA-[protein]-cysteine S-methyltransferase
MTVSGPTLQYFTEFSSPIGLLQLRGTEAAITGVYMEDHRRIPALPANARRDGAPFRDAQRELEEYFALERRQFSIAVEASGTDFQQRVWQELRCITYGTTVSYAELARRVGNPNAVRAVGMANSRNPVSILVPCHRVIAANGSLRGYSGGLERQQFLLALEARQPA